MAERAYAAEGRGTPSLVEEGEEQWVRGGRGDDVAAEASGVIEKRTMQARSSGVQTETIGQEG